jgi:threonine/homoserine/homoserine lactone efflux protein
MAEVQSLIFSWVVGAVSGFLVSIPVGPINITIVNEGAKRGFLWGCWIGAGAVLMEVIYCTVAFAGFTGLFGSDVMRAVMELASFLLMFILGVKYLLVRSLPATMKSVEIVEHRLHPHTAFMTGFVRVMGNPAVLLFWVTLSATFLAHEWMEDSWPSKFSCIAGVGTGALGWFVLLSFAVSLGHGRFSQRTLVRMSHVSGACLLIAAIAVGGRLVNLLAKSNELKAKVKSMEKHISVPFRRNHQ